VLVATLSMRTSPLQPAPAAVASATANCLRGVMVVQHAQRRGDLFLDQPRMPGAAGMTSGFREFTVFQAHTFVGEQKPV
jgi:hypothetical protein